MKKIPFMILSVILGMGISGFAQECPCVKTSVIGNDTSATFTHNNKVKSMPDTTIVLGSPVTLKTFTSVGKSTWFTLGSDSEITDLVVKPFVTTEFIVKSQLAGCPDAYDTVKIFVKRSSIGLDESINLSIFPNPTNGKLRINCKNKKIKKIEITDLNGKIIMQQKVFSNNPNQEINVAHLNSGMYFVRVTLSNNSSISKRILKN